MTRLSSESPAVHTRQPSLHGRHAVIFGGTSGIGRAVSGLLAAEGMGVLVLGTREDDVRETLAELDSAPGAVRGAVANAAEPADLERAFASADEAFGTIDVLVNIAGSYRVTPAEEWRHQFDADLDGFVNCTEHALKRLRGAPRGHIVNVGPSCHEPHAADGVQFVSVQAALRERTLALRRELARSGIKVSLVEAGTVGTSSFPLEAGADVPASERQLERTGEMLKPQDIAVAVHFCLTQPPRCTVGRVQLDPVIDA